MKEDGLLKWKDYVDYIVNYECKSGIGFLFGWCGEDGDKMGCGVVNFDQMDVYIENGGFYIYYVLSEVVYYKLWNVVYQDWVVDLGFYDSL